MSPFSNVYPEEWEHFAIDFGVDEHQLFAVKFVGTGAGTLTIAGTTGDMTFLIDASADATIGTAGVVDLSADVTDYDSLMRLINANDGWEAWLIGALPDDDPEASGSGDLLAVTAANCDGENGFAVLNDLSQIGHGIHMSAGLTRNGPSSKIHGHDGQVRIEMTRVIALATFTAGAQTLTIHACNDADGTSTVINTLPTLATTVQAAYPAETVTAIEPLGATNGLRIVAKYTSSVSLTAVRLKIAGRTRIFGPGIRQSKLYSRT